MSRIADAFKNGKAFIAFITGGDPSLEKTREFVLGMAETGADIIEIGIPFSDPIAEGPTIRAANIRSLSAGTTVQKLFGLAADLRRETDIPLLFMTYLNPVFHYGYEKFFAACKDSGIDGIIIPDLPYEEQGEVKEVANAFGVEVITLIAPTSSERIETLAASAQGFVYTVSSMGVTGVRSQLHDGLPAMLSEICDRAPVPVAVGFGISTPEQARTMARSADGVIVGSAIVNLVAEHGEAAGPHIRDYVGGMKAAIKIL